MKIILYTLYIHENVWIILFWDNPISELGYVIILFQSYRIGFIFYLLTLQNRSLTVSKGHSHDIWSSR